MRDTGPKSSGWSQTHAARLGILALLAAAMFALTGASAEAAYIHPESAYEFGPDGLATSAFPGSGSVAEMDFDQSSKRIFMLDKSDGKVYAIQFAGPGGELSPVFGPTASEPVTYQPGIEQVVKVDIDLPPTP